jgi:hypothetical protein
MPRESGASSNHWCIDLIIVEASNHWCIDLIIVEKFTDRPLARTMTI